MTFTRIDFYKNRSLLIAGKVQNKASLLHTETQRIEKTYWKVALTTRHSQFQTKIKGGVKQIALAI